MARAGHAPHFSAGTRRLPFQWPVNQSQLGICYHRYRSTTQCCEQQLLPTQAAIPSYYPCRSPVQQPVPSIKTTPSRHPILYCSSPAPCSPCLNHSISHLALTLFPTADRCTALHRTLARRNFSHALTTVPERFPLFQQLQCQYFHVLPRTHPLAQSPTSFAFGRQIDHTPAPRSTLPRPRLFHQYTAVHRANSVTQAFHPVIFYLSLSLSME